MDSGTFMVRLGSRGMLVNPVLRKLRKEGLEFKAILGYKFLTQKQIKHSYFSDRSLLTMTVDLQGLSTKALVCQQI